jgi:hypothetical protein
MKEGKFEIKNLYETVKLTKEQTDSLFSLLFRHTSKEEYCAVAACYEPRHAILFYEKGKALAFLEICFSCGRDRVDGKWESGNFCDGKFEKLRSYFKWVGIKKGL